MGSNFPEIENVINKTGVGTIRSTISTVLPSKLKYIETNRFSSKHYLPFHIQIYNWEKESDVLKLFEL